MNKFKNIIRKIPKTIWFLVGLVVGLVVLFKIAIEIPAFPYNLNFLPPNLDNHKMLYTNMFDVYLKTYNNGKAENKLIAGTREVVLDGLIIGDSSFFVTKDKAAEYIYMYIYKNDSLKKIRSIPNTDYSYGTLQAETVHLIKIDDDTIGIMHDHWYGEEKVLSVRVIDLKNTDNDRNVIVENQYSYDMHTFYPLPFAIRNNYEIQSLGQSDILFKEGYPKLEIDEKNFFYFCLMGGYMGGGDFCNGYDLYETALIDRLGAKTILDRSTNLIIMDRGYKSFNNLKLSTNKDFLIYGTSFNKYSANLSSGNIYVLDTKSGRKKLIEKNAYPLYME